MNRPPGPEVTAALDDMLDGAPCGFVTFTDEGRVVCANATLLGMLGRERDEVTGRHVETLLTVGSRVFYQTHLFPLVRMHGRAEEIFLQLRHADGSDVGVLLNIVRRERDGAAVYDAVLMRVRERQKYEEELLRAKRTAEEARTLLEEQAAELEASSEELTATNDELMAQTAEANRLREEADAANRSKSAFLAMMSHELRTPLNAIAGYVQLLAMGVQGEVNEKQGEMLTRIDRAQSHLLGLINEVLDLSRLEAGGVEYALEDVVVATVVDTVVPMIEPQLEAKGLGLQVDVPAGLAARADQDKVRQILINLLSNAIKFTPSGGAITLDASPGGAEEPGTLHLCVRDTGIGIAPEKQASVFEPFRQVDKKDSSTGTGLGLAISRDLARGMGGDLTLASEPGVGSTFTLVLPLAEPSLGDDGDAGAGQGGVPAGFPPIPASP